MQTVPAKNSLHVSVRDQTVELRSPSGEVLRSFPVSTSVFGLGSESGSYRTPLGRFRVAEKIGHDAPLGAVFKSRVPTGEIGLNSLDEDLVLTRILWLEGLDAHNVNTHARYIYFHGTNHEARIGEPASHGCIRLRNADMVELFAQVEAGAEVYIREVEAADKT